MVEYLEVFINDFEKNSFNFVVNLDYENFDRYYYEMRRGYSGLFVAWCNPKYGEPTKIHKGELSQSTMSTIETLIKSNGQKRYPKDYQRSDQLMGSPVGFFEVDYRMYGKTYFHHVMGKIEYIPDNIKEILRILVENNVISNEDIKDIK